MALENILSPPRRQNLPLRLRINPPSSPRPPLVSPQRRKRGRGPGRKHKQQNPVLATSEIGSDEDLFMSNPAEDARRRSPDFAFDTPGAGPSGRPDDHEPIRIFEDDWDGNVPIDSDSDDGRPEGPTFAAPWLEGLTASDILSQELEAEIAHTCGRTLTDEDMKTVRSFNYKVDTDMSTRAYNKLARAFPDELGDLPKHHALRTRIARLSGIKGVRIDCCVNSCMAFTGPFAVLNYCLYCEEDRYRPRPTPNARPSPRKYFQYLPLIPRLINMYRHPQTADLLAYRSTREAVAGLVCDIFDGQHYRKLCDSRVVVQGETLRHNFFSLPTDIALGLSSDGFGPFKSRKKTCWPLIAFNYNLEPAIRFRLENLLCLGVIPGPHAPKDIGSFLQPFIDELQDLARGVPALDSRHNRPFALRAYLIACFGDMPAVAKLMYMKGHNGKRPCRACRISGVRNPDHTPGEDHKTNYTALSRPFTTGRHEPREIDPLNLPQRNHTEFIIQANLVETAHNDAEADRRARHFGINALSPLSCLSSLDFPVSFPHDFMHAMFENVIPLLIDLWTHGRKFSTFGSGDEDYIIDTDLWKSICLACVQSGGTIPAIFGCRVPNLALERSQTTAESTLIFATLLAPALLRNRLGGQYYKHFVELVNLIDTCLALETHTFEIPKIRERFANWVLYFERLYYRHAANRLRVCTLPIHSLLHIADDIEAMGPVWCYWAFPMERFCGALGRANLNPRFPFASMDRRVLEVAQLAQIKCIYNLFEALDLGDRKHAIARGVHYPEYPDSVFVRPRRTITVNVTLSQELGTYIGNLYEVDSKAIERRVKGRNFDAWGKMQQTTNVDKPEMITGHSFMPDTETPRRDATFVKYVSEWDRSGRGRPKHISEGALAFGRMEYFLVLETDIIAELIAPSDGFETKEYCSRQICSHM
ncbi:unnamed protein product [Rhizoctonia solani]|uniref:Transposase family Tnp2 protein n=1 Tax=Rhizoctonia solani TaxID=456999 RepID=A0A8H3DRW6_9AGAM|nr:unnamed protein product [Rhizoctonia solani]